MLKTKICLSLIFCSVFLSFYAAVILSDVKIGLSILVGGFMSGILVDIWGKD